MERKKQRERQRKRERDRQRQKSRNGEIEREDFYKMNFCLPKCFKQQQGYFLQYLKKASQGKKNIVNCKSALFL